MEVYLNKVTGIDDALVSMMMSNRVWTKEREDEVREMCSICTDDAGALKKIINNSNSARLLNEEIAKLSKKIDSLVKIGKRHITLLRFIDFSFTVNGLHRAGQDDWDAHAYRFNNRIVRASSRQQRNPVKTEDKSDWYKGKILSTDEMLEKCNIDIPKEVELDGQKFVKVMNGYAVADLKEDPDVLRGLWMQSWPSIFIFKVNLVDWCHVYQERNSEGNAHPEVKMLAESCAATITAAIPQFNRELFMEVKS